MNSLKKIPVSSHLQHITSFLTMDCPRNCSYCINELSGVPKERNIMSGDQWIEIYNRLETNLSFILLGGEPLAHPDYYKIINGVNADIKFEMLTTLPYEIDEFIKNASPSRFAEGLPYAPLRVTFQPETMILDEIIEKTKKLHEAKFHVSLTFVNHPSIASNVQDYKNRIEKAGLTCVVRPFFGEYQGKLYGNNKYVGCYNASETKSVKCKTMGIYIDTLGDAYGCCGKLLVQKTEDKLGNFLDPNCPAMEDKYYPCDVYGNCHQMDITYRLDRNEKWGACGVDIVGDGVEIAPVPEKADWIIDRLVD